MMGVHAPDCAKANDHSKPCNCVLADNYEPKVASQEPICCLTCCHPVSQHTQMLMSDGSFGMICTSLHCQCKQIAVGAPGSKPEAVDHPNHYGGKDNVYETLKVIDAWGLDFALGNCVKYISRAGKKDPAKLVEDLQKAAFYLNHAIDNAKKAMKP